jgi:hypothetical protein
MSSLVRRVCAGLALVTFLGGFGLGTLTPGHLGLEDDAACRPLALSGSHPVLQLEAVPRAPSAGHCTFCHWQRIVGGADLGALSLGQVSLEPVERILPLGQQPGRSPAVDHHLSRAPPAFRV